MYVNDLSDRVPLETKFNVHKSIGQTNKRILVGIQQHKNSLRNIIGLFKNLLY